MGYDISGRGALPKGKAVEPTTFRARTGQEVGAGRITSGLCGALAQVASLPARFETYALPDDFVPGYSLKEALGRIRRLHSNYSELAEELELTCIQRATSGGKCRFSKELASGSHRLKCPALSLVWFTLKGVAEEKSEEAFTEWRQRRERQQSKR